LIPERADFIMTAGIKTPAELAEEVLSDLKRRSII
jgi:hypothetical protein